MPPSNAPKHANSLADDLVSAHLPRPKHKKRKSLHDSEDERSNQGQGYVDAKSSRKILKIGQELAEEEEAQQRSKVEQQGIQSAFQLRLPSSTNPGDEDEDIDPSKWEDEGIWGDEDEILEEVDVDPDDLDTFNKFMPAGGEEPAFDFGALQRSQEQVGSEAQEGTDLAALILERIAEHEAAHLDDEDEIQGGGSTEDAVEIPAKVVDVYTKVGQILSRYKSGKLPKPFKVLPTLPHWEELLSITAPDGWTPNACYEATKIFVSSRPAVVKPFLETVLLDRVREDIFETKKLNVHLYKALQKSTYKPAGFFKGIVFPLIESGTCTLREAHIVGSIVTRSSIPPLHASAALLRLTDLAAEQASSMGTENAGATNIFLKAFLEKKYALPYKVVDNLVFHFLRFRAMDPAAATGEDSEMIDPESKAIRGRLPVLWHQCLLAFAQRYRNDITEDQREALLDLIKERGHKDIGPEVRRELLAGRGRGVVVPEVQPDNGGDDTMIMDTSPAIRDLQMATA